jgi:septal ring factor EnvC (AmiA/AmiB activator)
MKIFRTFIISFLAFFLTQNYANAIKFNDVISVVEDISKNENNKNSKSISSKIEDEMNRKIDHNINKITGKIDDKISKYEQKLDKYEKKIDRFEKKIDDIEETSDQVLKATKKAIETVNSISKDEIIKYVQIAKYSLFAVVALFIILNLMIFVIFAQNRKIKQLLKNKNT